jgi:RHS repeat-associated protein
MTADGNNHLSGFSYDLSGNTQSDGVNSYAWDAESQLKSAAGVNYLYDGDGRRVSKSSGKLYWYGSGGEILAETDASGNATAEYIFFGGKRIAQVPSSGNPIYYVEDLLGTSRVITTNTGVVCYDADFYPYGGERSYTNTCPQNYKFEGKERDTETGNDDFGARYYSNRFGRWLSADWSSVPAPVPYANLSNPQTLNLYAMVSDDPESFADLDGHKCGGGEANCTSVVKVTELNNTAAHTLTVTQTDTTTRTNADGTKIETATKTVLTFSTDKANPGEFSAKEFATMTAIAKDGTRTVLAGSINPIFGDNISNAEAKNRLGADAIQSYQNKAIPSRAELFNREVRNDKAGLTRAGVELGLLGTPVPEAYELGKAIVDVVLGAIDLAYGYHEASKSNQD